MSENYKDNFFCQLFSCNEILRSVCHRGRYSNFYRPVDITLGDFWGIEKNFQQFDDDKCVSLVMVNTENGEKTWKAIKKNDEFFQVSQEQVFSQIWKCQAKRVLGAIDFGIGIKNTVLREQGRAGDTYR